MYSTWFLGKPTVSVQLMLETVSYFFQMIMRKENMYILKQIINIHKSQWWQYELSLISDVLRQSM